MPNKQDDDFDRLLKLALSYTTKNIAKILQTASSILTMFIGIIILNFFLFGIPNYRNFIEDVEYELSHTIYKTLCLNLLLNNLDSSSKATCGGFYIERGSIELYKISYRSLKQDLKDAQHFREIETKIDTLIYPYSFSLLPQIDISDSYIYQKHYVSKLNKMNSFKNQLAIEEKYKTEKNDSSFSFLDKKEKDFNEIANQYTYLLQQLSNKDNRIENKENQLADIEKDLERIMLEIDFYIKNLLAYTITKEYLFPYIWFIFYWIVFPLIMSVIMHMCLEAITAKKNWNKNMSENYVNNFHGANIGNVANNVKDYGRQQVNQNIYANENRKIIAESTAEIQKLLKQLEQYNSSLTEAEIIDYVNDETTPSFKRRLVGALQGGSEALIEEFFDNSYVNIGKAIIKGWIKPE